MDAIAEANALAAGGQIAMALPLYEEAARQNPGDERGYIGAVASLMRMKRHEEAAEWMEKLIRLSPGDAQLHGMMGSIMEGCGRKDEALACYEKALGIDPDDILTLFRAFPILIKRGRTKEGMEYLDRAMAAEPSDEHEAGAQRDMRAIMEKARAADGGGAEAAPARMRPGGGAGAPGPMPGMPGLPKSTSAGCEKAESPREAMARAGRLSGQGRLQEAADAIDAAIAGHPDLADAHSAKAAVLVQMGRYNDAAERMDAVLRLRPDGIDDLCAKAMLLERAGRPGEAIACYDRAIAVEPGETMAYYLKCGALAHAGDAEGLARCYRAALSSEPRGEGRSSILESMRREYARLQRCAQEAGSAESGLAAFVGGGGVGAQPHWGRAEQRARRTGRLRAGRRR